MGATGWDEQLAVLGLAADVAARLATYLARLEAATAQFNLVGDAPERWVTRHVADALRIGPVSGPLVDVGSGGGFPGLVLAACQPELAVTLVESVGKKARFLAEAAAALGLGGVSVLCERAEVVGQDPAHRERYTTLTTRALARPATALELTLPLVACGGAAYYFLGVEDAATFAHLGALDALGGEVPQLTEYGRSDAGEARVLARVPKVRATPAGFPRRVGVPKKRPLA